MGDIKGFLKHDRIAKGNEAPEQRKKHFEEFSIPWNKAKYEDQASRCMDCGIPFCHEGCPLGNKIPDFNDAVHRGNWQEAWELLKTTNNFPEFTGRICPAPCEASCVLGLNNEAVNIEHIEKEISETAFKEGWEKPIVPTTETGFKVAVIGSGPAGLAAAEESRKRGHSVTVFERDNAPGGLLRYGIPDFKLDKSTVARRVSLMEAAGIEFKTGVEIGEDITAEVLETTFDAIILCTGSTVPRNLTIEGRDLKGVHFAMDYLKHQNQVIAGEIDSLNSEMDMAGKRVVVIGGGDTGADCVGTSNRQGAVNVSQIELLEKPPLARATSNPWPEWPMVLTTSTSHEEGVDRNWALLTKRFIGLDGRLTGVETVKIQWIDQARFEYQEVSGTEEVKPCDAVFLAIGFAKPETKGIVEQFDLALDQKSNIKASGYKTSKPNVFAAGDCRRGQSLVVWAIAEGRKAAVAVNQYYQALVPKT
ncbi:glutamate synthase subunit beta [Roseivirga misakiensis]|uniref:Glutamate synthase n=1 Tax=Roseivirga misakiensis TaxID=1563681 RepID=A0A1E5T017_9BACT|nr:glutamate synthase subunit beta [Roseivirga misakiensis]OEK04722.1 glutamate synthase [Roseivirga misakiensis]